MPVSRFCSLRKNFKRRSRNFSILHLKFFDVAGYGVAFPKNSMWIPKFNEYLMRYRENGDLERMQRFWFTGACEPRKRRRTSSKPLALAQVTHYRNKLYFPYWKYLLQFMSAFLLLALGITFSGFLLLCEHGYFRYLRKYLAHFRNTAWCNLISIGNLLERLAFRPLKMLWENTLSSQWFKFSTLFSIHCAFL